MLLLARLENRPSRLDLSFYPYLPSATVGITDTRAYLGLTANKASVGAVSASPVIIVAPTLEGALT